MKFVVGPPWLRVTVKAGDAALARRLAHQLGHAGAEQGAEAEGPTLEVLPAADISGSGGVGFELKGNIFRGKDKGGEGWYDAAEGKGEFSLTPGGGLFFQTVLRQIFFWESYRKGGVVLHSVAFADGDDVIVSCGPSGSGKSTLAGVLRTRFTVYTDDMNVVDGDGRVWALPFRGTGVERVNAGGGLLRALAFHRPGREFKAEPLEPADAARELWPSVFIPEPAGAKLKGCTFERVAALVGRAAAFVVDVPLEENAAGLGFSKILKEVA
ncbi:MAG: hypothetical protein GTN49_06765 [candidate division Zixibacteria bacterium]|nr:hypothetical protein [candidate division Zixibacteria bacterium]